MKFGTLHLKLSDGKTRDYPLDQPSVSVGRAQDNDLIIEDTSVSRRHARLSVESGKLMIEDLGSANGTFIGSQRLTVNTSSLVPDDQVVRLGDVEVRYTPAPVVEATQAFAKPKIETVAPAASDGPPVSISLVGPSQPVAPGAETTANLTIQNRGTVVDELIIKVSGIPIEWVRLAKDRVPLLPKEQETVKITFAPPRRPEAAAGEHAFFVSVISREHQAGVDANGTLTIQPYYSFSFNLNPQRSTRDFMMMVHNQGNAPETFNLAWRDQANELAFTTPHTQLTVPEGQESAVQFKARPRRWRWLGGEKQHPFAVQVSPSTGEAQEQTGQLISHGLIPTWLPLLFVVLALLLCGTLYALFVKPPVIEVTGLQPLNPLPDEPVVVSWQASNCQSVEVRLNNTVQVQSLPCNGQFIFSKLESSAKVQIIASNVFAPIVGLATHEIPITVVPPAPLPLPTPTLIPTSTPTTEPPPPVIQDWKVSPTQIVKGQSVIIQWTVSDAESAQLSPIGPMPLQGQMSDTPDKNTTYILSAVNHGKTTVSNPIQVVVIPPADTPLPPPTMTPPPPPTTPPPPPTTTPPTVTPPTVQSSIDQKYAALGGAGSFLKNPTGPELIAPDGIGHFRPFDGGSIYWTPETGAHEVHGAIKEKWADLGWEKSWLGYPISDEEPSTGGWARQSRFEHGTIKWSSDNGAQVFAQSMTAKPSNFIVNQLSGRCIDVKAPSGTANELPLQLYDCEWNKPNTDQKWTMTPDGFIVNQLSGRCIDVKAPSGTANELPLQLYDCEWNKPNTDQKWTMTPDGFIVNQLSGRCIDVKAASGTANELPLQLYDCEWNNPTTDQRWAFR